MPGRPSLFSRSFPFFLAVSLLIIFWTAAAFAQFQPEFPLLFSPEVGGSKSIFNFQGTFYEKEDVPGQSRDFRLTRYSASLSAPIAQDRDNEWSILGRFRGQEIHTDALLPDTKQTFPDGLWDVRLGPSYRHRFDNGWIGGGVLTVGSASDRPFASMEETEVQATAHLLIPQGQKNAWIFLLSYSNNREFANNVPLPGFAYLYQPSDRYRLLIGFPFAFFQYRPNQDLSLELSYVAVTSIRSRITYRLLKPLHVYAAFEWFNEGYFRADRTDRWDRFFYYEKRVFGGVRWDLLKKISLDLSSGYAFDRLYFEGKNYWDRDFNRVDVSDGPFLSLRANLLF